MQALEEGHEQYLATQATMLTTDVMDEVASSDSQNCGLSRRGMTTGRRIRAAYTRQPQGPWTFYIGQCELSPDALDEREEIYKDFAFVIRAIRGQTIKSLLEALFGNGVAMPQGLPSLRFPSGPRPNWEEKIVPSYANRFGALYRRLTARLEQNAFFNEGPLIDYVLPYRPSAAQHLKTLMGFKAFHDTVEARKGTFTLNLRDQRGTIRFASGTISISGATEDLRLVGNINGDMEVSVRNADVQDYDVEAVRSIELWLLTKTASSSISCPRPIGRTAITRQRGRTSLGSATREISSASPATGRDVARMRNRPLLLMPARFVSGCENLSRTISAATSRWCTYQARRVTVGKSEQINFLVKSGNAQIAYIRHGATSKKLAPPEMKTMLEAELSQRRMF
jgi:hypothetical protein